MRDIRYRALRWQYAYIDKSVSEEVLECIVLPKFIPKLEDGTIDFNYDTKIEDHYEWFE